MRRNSREVALSSASWDEFNLQILWHCVCNIWVSFIRPARFSRRWPSGLCTLFLKHGFHYYREAPLWQCLYQIIEGHPNISIDYFSDYFTASHILYPRFHWHIRPFFLSFRREKQYLVRNIYRNITKYFTWQKSNLAFAFYKSLTEDSQPRIAHNSWPLQSHRSS